MFHRYGKKIKSLHAKPMQDLTRIVPAPLLLAEEKRKTLLQQIRALVAFEEARYDSLCSSLLQNLANHCQSLPETSNSYYSQAGGLIDHALNRTEAALGLFQTYLMQGQEGELSEEQKLWQYALFTAAILQGIAKLQIDLSVELYDNNGHFLKKWNPLLENLVSVGSHYHYEFQKETDEEFRRRLNLLLARLLMPASGFSWIASNPQVLAVWLALLNEDAHAAGTLGAILVHADGLALQRYFNQWMLRSYGSRGSRYGRASFSGGAPDSIANMEQLVGISFLQWLTRSLEDGSLMINKAPLFLVPGGLLMSLDIFKGHPEFNSAAVQQGLLSLGLHRLAADGSIHSRFESSNHQMQTGLVIADKAYAALLPAKLRLYNMHTGKASPITATELIYQAKFNTNFTQQKPVPTTSTLPALNSSGQWVPAQPIASSQTSSSLRPGIINGV